MAVTEQDKENFANDSEGLFFNGGEPVASLEEAEAGLAESERPFVMFRYLQVLPNHQDPPVEKERVRTAVLYRKDGETVLIDPEIDPDAMHPVRLVLLTLTNLFFPRSESPFPADDDVFRVIRSALEAAELDPHIFDGGGNQLG